MKRLQRALATLIILAFTACGGIVNFSSDADFCEGQPCGEPCEDGGTCTGEGTCSYTEVFCCVLGSCGDECSICIDDECVSGSCTEDGACVQEDVTCAL